MATALGRLNAFSGLSREARDVVFQLSVVGWLIAPQAQNIPVWASFMAVAFLFWRGYLAVKGLPLPNRIVLGALTMACFGFTALQFGTIISRDSGIALTVLMLCIKSLELRAKRDAFVMFFLGFFTVTTNFLISQTLLTTVVMFVGVWGLLAVLVNIHIPTGRPSLLIAIRKAFWMLLLGSPIMLALFFSFPRVGPLWAAGFGPPKAKTGLTESMQAGTIATLALDSSIAMRLKFEGEPPPPEKIYLRGPVLSDFDGVTWTKSNQSRRFYMTPAALDSVGDLIRYEVILEPSGQDWIFGLDLVTSTPNIPGADVGINRDHQMVSSRMVSKPLRYSVTSAFEYRLDVNGDSTQGATYLPARGNIKTRELGERIRAANPGADALGLSKAVFKHLATGGYSYSLSPGTFGDNPADEFWFIRKQGFCEHISSSYVILMRSMGVPARVVTGYQGGDKNPIDGYVVVRQSNAHAWAEIWDEKFGWVRQDPTFAVSPARISSQLVLQPSTGPIANAFGINQVPRFWLSARSAVEAFSNGYNQWVLNYSSDKQASLLDAFKLKAGDVEKYSYWLVGLLVGGSAIPMCMYLLARSRRDPWLLLMSNTVAALKRAGHTLPEPATPRAIAERFPVGSPAHEWFIKMDRARYGHVNGLELRDLRATMPKFN